MCTTSLTFETESEVQVTIQSGVVADNSLIKSVAPTDEGSTCRGGLCSAPTVVADVIVQIDDNQQEPKSERHFQTRSTGRRRSSHHHPHYHHHHRHHCKYHRAHGSTIAESTVDDECKNGAGVEDVPAVNGSGDPLIDNTPHGTSSTCANSSHRRSSSDSHRNHRSKNHIVRTHSSKNTSAAADCSLSAASAAQPTSNCAAASSPRHQYQQQRRGGLSLPSTSANDCDVTQETSAEASDLSAPPTAAVRKASQVEMVVAALIMAAGTLAMIVSVVLGGSNSKDGEMKETWTVVGSSCMGLGSLLMVAGICLYLAKTNQQQSSDSDDTSRGRVQAIQVTAIQLEALIQRGYHVVPAPS